MFRFDFLPSQDKVHRASHWGAFFIGTYFLVLVLVASPAYGMECQADRIDETVAISQVVDGDTLRLKDGRLIRFIGINTPELARKGIPAEPLAEKARQSLIKLLENTSLNGNIHIGLRYGKERKDRYGRELAHVFLNNGESVEAKMLMDGMAAQIVVPPNIWNIECYRSAEKNARQANKGVWGSVYQPVPAKDVPENSRGFRIISGKIVQVGKSKRSVWLNFISRPDKGEKEGVAVRISRKNLNYFNNWNPERLEGKEVIVRGWLYPYKKQLVMQLHHPFALEIKSKD